MTRTLHVIDQSGPAAQTPALRLSIDIARQGPAGDLHAWLLVGGEPMMHAAHALGLDETQYQLVQPQRGLQAVLPGATRSIARRMDEADRVECWTQGAAELAALVGCAHATPRYAQLTDLTLARGVIEACAAARPAMQAQQQRDAIRQRWGVGPQQIVMALLADRPDRVDAREPILAMAFTFEMMRTCKSERADVRLLCHPLARRRYDGVQLAELMTFPDMLLQDPALSEPWRILQACDIALAPEPEHAPLSILWASALGLTVVAAATPTMPALGGLPNVLLAESGVGKHMARVMTRWAMDQSPSAHPLYT